MIFAFSCICAFALSKVYFKIDGIDEGFNIPLKKNNYDNQSSWKDVFYTNPTALLLAMNSAFAAADADVALLAAGFSRGEPAALAVPYARTAAT